MSAVRGKPDATSTWRPPLLLTHLRHQQLRLGPVRLCRTHRLLAVPLRSNAATCRYVRADAMIHWDIQDEALSSGS